MRPNVPKNGKVSLSVNRKKVTGDRSGNVIAKNRRMGPAPSTLAASSTEPGMGWGPAREKARLYPNCFQTPASTMSASATQPFKNQLNWYAVTNDRRYGRTPNDG